jgi:RND family efflux transporter MFP subunit
VLTFERIAKSDLDAESMQLCAAVAAALGPMLDLKRIQDKPWWSQGGDALVGSARERHATFVRVGGLLLILACVVALGIINGDYLIAAPATVQGRVQRAVVAPFEGFLESAAVRAGDRVKEGMILAQLDDDSLLLEQRKWRSQREELVKQYRRALVARDRAESMVLETRVAQADAELELLAAQLERTALRAPFDGVIVSGDLSRALGAPVSRGQLLFEVAPLNDYRVVLQVDERDMSALRLGLPGTLALTGMPDARIPVMVQKIGSSAQDADGRNVVRVEARIEDPLLESPGALRPGMHGVAKINAGERRLLWIWTHGLVDWARLALWSELP